PGSGSLLQPGFMELLQHARPAQQAAHGIGGLRAVLQPFQRLFLVDLDVGRLGQRIVVADFLDETAVARRTRIGDDDAVERSLVVAQPSQPDTHCHVGFTSPSESTLRMPDADDAGAPDSPLPAVPVSLIRTETASACRIFSSFSSC